MGNPFEESDDEFSKNYKINVPKAVPAPIERNPFEDAPKSTVPAPKNNDVSTLDGLTRVASNALTLGLRDRVVGMLPGRSFEEEANKTADYKKKNPWSSVAAEVFGGIIPGVGAAKVTSAAIPALAKATLPSMLGNAAVSGAGQSAVEDVIKGEVPDPKKAALSALFGAGGAGVFAGAGRLMPRGRVKAAASDLTPEDIVNMRGRADRAASENIPLRIPELARAEAPGRSAGVEGLDNFISRLKGGNEARANVDAARMQNVGDAVERVRQTLGNGPATGVAAKNAAEKELARADDIITNSADPYYKKAAPTMVQPPPMSPSIDEARRMIRKDPIVGPKTQGDVRGSVGELHNVQQQIEAIIRGAEKNPQKEGMAIADKRSLVSAMENASPDYRQAQDIVKQGRSQLMDELKAGPLGAISRTDKPNAQAQALFKADSPAEVSAANRAVERLSIENPAVPKSILATHIDDAAKDVNTFGRKVIPNDRSAEVMRKIAGDTEFDRVANTLEALKTRTPAGQTHGGENSDGPVSGLWNSVQNLGSKSASDIMSDPRNIEKLLGVGPVQSVLNALGLSAGAEAADAQTKPKRRRRDKDEEKKNIRSASTR